MRISLLLLITLASSFLGPAYAQSGSCEPNMDFELGNFNNWYYYYENSFFTTLPTATTSVTPSLSTKFAITSGTGIDAYGIPIVAPGGLHSLLMGDTLAGLYNKEKAAYHVHVPAGISNYTLVYSYAYVLQYPSHAHVQEPRMTIRAYDSVSGTDIPYSYHTFIGDSSGMGSGAIRFQPWTTQTLDLSGYSGHTVIMEFAASDCGAGGHFGYCYVDMNCGLYGISSVVSCGASTVQLSAPPGYASYAWYDSATFTTPYGSTQTVTTPTPATAFTIAVIITPSPGYGVTDTLYTVVYPSTCSGTPVPGTVNTTMTSACITSPFTLTNVGFSNVNQYQWQSSPDSVIWTSISGATNSTYTMPGVSANTFFRCKDSCCTSGLSAVTPGLKITYAPCCSGAPVAGMATASTAYCSACSLTLSLTGFSLLPGMAIQWESSPDSITWTSIPSAITSTYTLSPSGSYYYRCRVACLASGLAAYSTPVFVPYAYRIIADSVNSFTSAACPGPGPEFYVKINGVSPLLQVRSFYGDGANASFACTPESNTSYCNNAHSYSFSGHYTIKHVLYWNTIPQDSVTFNYTYQKCKLLPISIYSDINNNCHKDLGETSTTPVLVYVDSNSVPIDTISATSGFHYQAYGPIGTVYSFRLSSPAYYVSCPATGILSFTITGSSLYFTKSFGLTATCTTSTDYNLVVYRSVICATNIFKASVLAINSYCYPAYATLTVNMTPRYTYFGASPFPSYGSGATHSWIKGNISASTPTTMTHVNFQASPLLHVGDTVHSSFLVTPVSGDVDSNNNTITEVDTAKGSYDPNIISVLPHNCFLNDTTLQYTIHFENTGNDTAHNIHVMDTLSDNLDMKTLEIKATSAEMYTTLCADGPYNIVKFDFPDINLPDSSQHDLCDAMFVYTIKTKQGIADGSKIFNRAGIYFDDNDVVMTNTTENTKGCYPEYIPAFTSSDNIRIYPNPATDELTITADANVYTSCIITNNVGQSVLQHTINGAATRISVKTLPAGIYYVTLRGNEGVTVRKFVKM